MSEKNLAGKRTFGGLSTVDEIPLTYKRKIVIIYIILPGKSRRIGIFNIMLEMGST